MIHPNMAGKGLVAAAMLAMCASVASAQQVDVRSDGAVALPAVEVPPSSFFSEEGERSRVEHILTERSLKGMPIDEFNVALFGPRLERTKAAFPVTVEASEIAGVPVLIYEPEGGVASEHRDRVIINLHGGGFVGCFVECGGLESIPVAAISGLRVIGIDYRMFPEVTFPAASDDVEAVWRELLKTYSPEHMAIFGCSAGGVLTSQALARFHAAGLPQPAAAAILCAGGGDFGGDSMTLGMMLGDGELPRATGGAPGGYMSTADEGEPTADPTRDEATLASFPPTMIGVGTRDFAMSSATYLHRRLVRAGVDAQLHVWDGGRHAFFYDVRVPETLEVFTLLSTFFGERLGVLRDGQ